MRIILTRASNAGPRDPGADRLAPALRFSWLRSYSSELRALTNSRPCSRRFAIIAGVIMRFMLSGNPEAYVIAPAALRWCPHRKHWWTLVPMFSGASTTGPAESIKALPCSKRLSSTEPPISSQRHARVLSTVRSPDHRSTRRRDPRAVRRFHPHPYRLRTPFRTRQHPRRSGQSLQVRNSEQKPI